MKGETMDLLRTQQTYKTRENAIKALENRVGKERAKDLQWIIAVNENGRFAPVVRAGSRSADKRTERLRLKAAGITII